MWRAKQDAYLVKQNNQKVHLHRGSNVVNFTLQASNYNRLGMKCHFSSVGDNFQFLFDCRANVDHRPKFVSRKFLQPHSAYNYCRFVFLKDKKYLSFVNSCKESDNGINHELLSWIVLVTGDGSVS